MNQMKDNRSLNSDTPYGEFLRLVQQDSTARYAYEMLRQGAFKTDEEMFLRLVLLLANEKKRYFDQLIEHTNMSLSPPMIAVSADTFKDLETKGRATLPSIRQPFRVRLRLAWKELLGK